MAEDEEEIRISEEEISAILKSFRCIKEFDEVTGILVPFMKMDCCVCKNEQSMIMLVININT